MYEHQARRRASSADKGSIYRDSRRRSSEHQELVESEQCNEEMFNLPRLEDEYQVKRRAYLSEQRRKQRNEEACNLPRLEDEHQVRRRASSVHWKKNLSTAYLNFGQRT